MDTIIFDGSKNNIKKNIITIFFKPPGSEFRNIKNSYFSKRLQKRKNSTNKNYMKI
jgi:hypothetical protein